jgi:hypothetical protein
MIEYFRLNIEDLWFAFGLRPVGVERAYAPEGGSVKKDLPKNDSAKRFPQIFNFQLQYSQPLN